MTDDTGFTDIADAIDGEFVSPNVKDSNGQPANVVDVLSKVGDEIREGFKSLGNNGADTQMGALEAHGMCILEASENIANAIGGLAEAIRNRSA